jgi:NAD(P)-dependent dehydrogenase (short-subunit alcohol dehydrogenase family)
MIEEDFMEKVWLITGSSRGLGRVLSEAILASGDKLVATARTPAQLADLVDRYGDQVRTVALDVTDEGEAVSPVLMCMSIPFAAKANRTQHAGRPSTTAYSIQQAT